MGRLCPYRRLSKRSVYPMRSMLVSSVVAFVCIYLTARAEEKPTQTGKPTPLSLLAARMKPGTWAELKTLKMDRELFTDGSHSCIGDTDEAIWDPNTRQLFFSGVGHADSNRFIKYSEATNSWSK